MMYNDNIKVRVQPQLQLLSLNATDERPPQQHEQQQQQQQHGRHTAALDAGGRRRWAARQMAREPYVSAGLSPTLKIPAGVNREEGVLLHLPVH